MGRSRQGGLGSDVVEWMGEGWDGRFWELVWTMGWTGGYVGRRKRAWRFWRVSIALSSSGLRRIRCRRLRPIFLA